MTLILYYYNEVIIINNKIMQITITTANQTLQAIFAADANAAVFKQLLEDGYTKMTIINNSANIVNKDVKIAATPTLSRKIAIGGGETTFIIKDTRDINLITVNVS